MPARELLHSLFAYSFVEGALYWKVRLSPKARLDQPAGSTDPEGYRVITVNGKTYRRHRLVWAYFNCDPGNMEIDHLNGVKGDDRLENLRLATRRENSWNTTYKTNKSGAPGVCWHARDKKWRVSIKDQGINKHLGYYSDLQEAQKAYIEASRSIHGSFSVFNRI